MEKEGWKVLAISMMITLVVIVIGLGFLTNLGMNENEREQKCVNNCNAVEECKSYEWDSFGKMCNNFGYTADGEPYLIRTYKIN